MVSNADLIKELQKEIFFLISELLKAGFSIEYIETVLKKED